MKNLFRFLMLLTTLAAANIAGLAREQKAETLQGLIGKWRGSMADERQPTMELVITAAKIAGTDLRSGDSLGEGRYSCDPVKGILDAEGVANPVRGQRYLGIYSLQGDTLKWCSNNGSGKRPVRLVHNPGQGQFLMILKREK
jgi:hypothetical protein